MKYKLIKIYPGSPELGKEITSTNGWRTTFESAHNYPEFWQKVEELEYEVLSVYGINGANERLYTVKDNVLTPSWNSDLKYSQEDINVFPIHSVKRLSDGEVFTIGDLIQCENRSDTVEIISFTKNYLNNQIWIDTKGKLNGIGLQFATKPKAKPVLLITNDGVEIFEGDKIYPVELKYYKLHLNAKAPSYTRKPEKFNIFSTKEKAEDFILFNKPVLSLNELLEAWEPEYNNRNQYINSPLFQNFKNAAQQKLTKN